MPHPAATTNADVTLVQLTEATFEDHVVGLAEVLTACVADGASVSFVDPFGVADALRFWRGKVFPGVASGEVDLLVGLCAGEVAGTVQLACDTPANQPQRADVRKLLVHPRFRRRGLARRLMQAVELQARARNRTLLTLDTRTGDAGEQLYLDLGYQVLGRIPAYALDPRQQRFEDCTFLYKHLA
ncbi:GNAT family N-acetyltransferase [Pannonibacter tanglangensis]|uniref:GNAT family N-acetyltransferase n=1 Tax=Pannonibacter tanglangensis TaxID=2750084 RepID=A0ABW9ZL11_9HYPH|nr:GNAT family N-acetyltransferase [Pannonibacter sp. XCT-34]NBN64723.1 GNAT family N-acetyltransferase [Pannonibacter sp. XCT-34]